MDKPLTADDIVAVLLEYEAGTRSVSDREMYGKFREIIQQLQEREKILFWILSLIFPSPDPSIKYDD